MKRIIVTGPTGTIGVALIELLISKQMEVTAICRKDSERIKNLPESQLVKVVECNLDELRDLSKILTSDYDVFFHFAWDCTIGDGRNNIQAQICNIQYTLDAVELANELGCKKFIGAGSQAEYGRYEGVLNAQVPTNPENGYGMAKLCAGQMSRIRCRQLGIEHVWVRVLSVYGPYDGLNTLIVSVIKALLRNEVPHCTKGEQIWDYIYSKDAARAFWAVAESGINGKTYCLGSGEARVLADYIKTIHKLMESELALGLGDISYNPEQVMYLCADISELTKDTGFMPETSFEDGILKTIGWVRKVLVND